jgi:hypothetical protein
MPPLLQGECWGEVENWLFNPLTLSLSPAGERGFLNLTALLQAEVIITDVN